MAQDKPTTRPKPATDAGDKSGDNRITLPLDARGGLDYDRMQEKSRTRVRAWMADPALAARLGVATPAMPGPALAVGDVLPDALLDSLIAVTGQISAALVERTIGATSEQAALMLFTEREQTAIRPPLRNVLNKYGSTVLSKYGDEVALLAILTGTVTTKVAAVKAAMDKPATGRDRRPGASGVALRITVPPDVSDDGTADTGS